MFHKLGRQRSMTGKIIRQSHTVVGVRVAFLAGWAQVVPGHGGRTTFDGSSSEDLDRPPMNSAAPPSRYWSNDAEENHDKHHVLRAATGRRRDHLATTPRRASGSGEGGHPGTGHSIAAQRRQLPMVKMPDYSFVGEGGPVRLLDVFDGKHQLITYHHMWSPGEEWQCGGCTGFTSQFTRLQFLEPYDARFVIVTQGPIAEALAYRDKVGNKMTWYSTADSPFGADVDAPPGGGFAVNVFLRDGDNVYRTWHTSGRGTEQLSHTFPDRPVALGPTGAVAGLPRGLATIGDLRRLAALHRHRSPLRTRRQQGLNAQPLPALHHGVPQDGRLAGIAAVRPS